ncbi:hypothetical protein [Brevibacillus brevis]|uniref:hypothetical protein n=1 Tax=Brevibacillus brevis TaxID=1393 RepID=UPI0021BD06FA|nr:hypothetical protein [Brevibacillus brevis]
MEWDRSTKTVKLRGWVGWIKTNKKKQGVLMDVGGTLAIVGAGYGLLSDKQVQALQQVFELLLAAF